MKDPRISDQESALISLRRATRERSDRRISLCSPTLLAALRLLLGSRYQMIQNNAVMVLVILSLEPRNKVPVMLSDAVPALVEVLRCEHDEARDNAALVEILLNIWVISNTVIASSMKKKKESLHFSAGHDSVLSYCSPPLEDLVHKYHLEPEGSMKLGRLAKAMAIGVNTKRRAKGLLPRPDGFKDDSQRIMKDIRRESGGCQAELKSGVDISHTTEARLIDLLDMIIYVPVHQIFHGIREHFLVSTELKFNCFPLMPVVDKLPVLLREDLESAFDDLDNITSSLNVTNS
ncbi:hypothetical protein J5N97_023751 [Dioscorea zingiberensis]|uniref:Uncharacterized protein n=1 Tax=Dioscorea zingiberensis TaxID=325984 RepID=A0A9D5C5S1_9LILI|nr:hypothetical protein J5N97_023751 [Dioscorea zingiberensis]